MSSTTSNGDFWTKIQGICTIIGLGIGSILTLVTLWLAILSYRQMNSIKQHIAAPSFGDPPPPYADSKEEKSKSKKSRFGVIAIPVALSGSNSGGDDDMARGNIRSQVRSGRLGQRRWFIALLIVMIILTCGVIAVAANISNIQKLSNSKSLPQAAVLPNPKSNPNPSFATISLTQATTTSDGQTATSIVPAKNVYSTTYIHGTAFLVFPDPTTIAVGNVPDSLTASTTIISGSPYIVVTGSTNIPIATTDSVPEAITSTTRNPSATETDNQLHARPSLSSESELSSITSFSISLPFATQFVTIPTIMREVVISGITFTEYLYSLDSGSQTTMSSSSVQIELSTTGIKNSVDSLSSAVASSQESESQIVSFSNPSITASSSHRGFLGFEVLSVPETSSLNPVTSMQTVPASILSQFTEERPSTIIAFNQSSSFTQLSSVSILPVSTSTTFKGGTSPTQTTLSIGTALHTQGFSPLATEISVSQSLNSQVNSTMSSSFTDPSTTVSRSVQIESFTSPSSSLVAISSPNVLSTFSVVIITTSVVLETSGTTATSLKVITSTIPKFQTFQTTETSMESSTFTLSLVETFQTTESSLAFTTSTLSTARTPNVFEIFQTTVTLLEFTTSTLATIKTSLIFQTLDMTAKSLETLSEVTTSTVLTRQTSMVFWTSDITETSLETIIASSPEALESGIVQTSEVTITYLDITTSTLLLDKVVEITQTSLEIITTTLSLVPDVVLRTSDITLTSMEVITTMLLQTSLLFETSTLQETPEIQTQMVLQTSALYETFTVQEVETVLKSVTEVHTTVLVQTSFLYETFTALEATTSVQTSLVLQTSVLYDTSTILEVPPAIYETSTFQEVETVLETFMLFQTSLLYKTLTTLQAVTAVQTSSVLQTSILYETSTILETLTEIQNSLVVETSAIYETSTVLEYWTASETSIVLETSTILETSLALETSTILETSTVLEFLSKAQTEMIFQTSILFETSIAFETYTSIIFQTHVPLNPPGHPLTFSTAIASNPTSTAVPGSYSYQGCISDNENRTLSGLHTTSASMTTEKCAKYCSDSAYFGTEYGSQCWCGNTIWEYAGIAATESYCNTTCTGNQDEICGATWWMSLYQYD